MPKPTTGTGISPLEDFIGKVLENDIFSLRASGDNLFFLFGCFCDHDVVLWESFCGSDRTSVRVLYLSFGVFPLLGKNAVIGASHAA